MREKQKDEILLNEHVKKINLCISNKCFLKCVGCYNNFCYKKLISSNEINDFLKYAKSKGLKKVTLSGGDPLTRDDIIEILENCFKLNLEVNLDTTGFSFIRSTKIINDNKFVEKFKKINLLRKISMIGIPLDGSNEEIITKFRMGIKDIYKKQIEVIDFFEKNNINICINTVYHSLNSDDMLNIYNIIKQYRCVKKWQIFQFMPIGPSGKANESKFSVSIDRFMLTENIFDKINDKNMVIEFKPAIKRQHNYMLVDSFGLAYKVDLNNNKEEFGNIANQNTWDNIINNLL